MNFLNFDLKKIFILALLVSVPLISVNMQQRSKDKPWILIPFYYLSGLTQSSYSTFSSGVRSTTDRYLNLIDIKVDNQKLQNELAELKAQLGSMTELKLENERLNGLLDFKQKSNMKLLAARIVGRDILLDYNSVTINRGEEHGVVKGMGVITISGVVGYIIEVEPKTSKVLLITDRYAIVDGIVQRSRARGLVQGITKETCSLSFLKRSDDVQKDDIIVTSGLDGHFPKGFPIGTVTDVVKDTYAIKQEVTLKPAVSETHLEEVFIVLNANNQDFENGPDEKE